MPAAFLEVEDSASPAAGAVGVASLRFVPADRRGVLDADAFASLESFCRAAKGRPSLRVVLLRGAGDSLFAAGADLGEIAALTPESAGHFADRARDALAAWEALDATTVAHVEGACFGGALDLVLCCDLVLAGPGARFAHPGVSRGIVTGWGGTSRARRRLGEAALMHLFADGGEVDAGRALGNGLADFAVDGPAEALAMAARWAGPGGDALRDLKRVCREVEGLPLSSALAVEERTAELLRLGATSRP